ncbi:methionyl-tRNA formyltransferase, partial [Candidatus Aerophobetes bacterium]|nr:methionyl-tRNA formyltransferase [Candidatus Aerophobetes bacterium]
MGTSGFGCPSLEKLTESEEVLAVVTQPDKPAGRGKRILPPPVKLLAEKKNIPVYQPQDIRESSFTEEIARLKPHLIVVVAFGKILPPQIFNIPRIFSINLHPSLLPRLRGPAPIPWAIIRGEPFTGVTVQRITERVDEGEIILQEKIRIEPEDTCGTLTEKLSLLGAEVLLRAIQLIKEGKASLTPQDGEVSYAPRIRKEEGKINWEKPAREIHNLVRALNPYPGAFTIFTW